MRAVSTPEKATSAPSHPPGAQATQAEGQGHPGEMAFAIATASGIGIQRLAASTEGGPYGTIVEDDVEPGPIQIRRSEFVAQASAVVESVAERELSRVGKTAEDCPYLAYYVRYYHDKPAAHLERMIARYARPVSTDPQSLIDAMRERVQRAIAQWATSGKVETPVAQEASTPAAVTVAGFDGPAANPTNPEALRAGLGAGRPLEASTRTRMERGFGRDFGHVRVHNDAHANRAATSLSSRAFTVGNDIAFGAGQYRPGSTHGDLMLAHELAHVMQQGPTGAGSTIALGGSSLERAADAAAQRVVFPHLHMEAHPDWSLESQVRRGSGLMLQRCSANPDLSSEPEPPSYDEVVLALRDLYDRKTALLTRAGADIETVRKDIDEQIAEQVAKLRTLGVLLDENTIASAVTAPNAPRDLRKMHGRIVRTPEGETFEGQRMTFRLFQDYLPPGRSVRLLWRWRDKDGKAYDIMLGSGRFIRGEAFTLDDLFWNVIHPREKFQVFCEVRLGDEDAAIVDTPSTDWITLNPPPSGALEIEGSTKNAIVDAPVVFQIKGRSLQLKDRYVEWLVDEEQKEHDVLVFRHRFGSTGTKTVTARIYEVKRGFWGDSKTILNEASTTVEVKSAAQVGESSLAAATGPPASLKDVARSIRETLPQIAVRAKQGGEQALYWKERYEAQEERLKGIAREVPFVSDKGTQTLPSDLGALDPAVKYTAPIPTVIVYPEYGVQPIQMFLSVESAGGVWKAKLIDVTGKKIIHFEGSSSKSPLAAVNSAFDDWKDDNPYPKEGTLSYSFSPQGWTFPKSFSTYRLGKAAQDFVDSVLAVGGFILAGLLLAAPEATITKVLGVALLGLGVARSTVQIFKNVDLGYDLLDKENILEGLNIATAFLGMGGTFMRSLGAEARAVRPFVYRVGNVMVMGSLTADVGTLVYATTDAYEQLKAAQGDPTMDEGARNAQALRIISNLLLSGTLVFISNRSLFKNMKGTDFLKGKLPTSDTVEIGKATRLDLELELRKGGRDPIDLRAMSDRELLSAFLLEQRKQAAIKKADDLRSTLSDPAKKEFDAMRTGHEPEDLAKAIEDLPDPKARFEALAAETEKRRQAQTAPDKPVGPETADARKTRLGEALEAKKLADADKRAAKLQVEHRKNVADAEKRGKLPPIGSEERAWLDADPSGRRKELAYDPPQDKFKVPEAKAALQAELNGKPVKLDPPVRRSLKAGRAETGADYVDGRGVEWDHVQLTDASTAEGGIMTKAYPERPGAQGENAIADCLDLSRSDAERLMDDWSKKPHPAGTGRVVFVLPQ